jgi:Na+/proline symporter
MNLLTPIEGLAILSAFGMLMLALVWFKSHKHQSADSFLVADREVALVKASFSIAVSWI